VLVELAAVAVGGELTAGGYTGLPKDVCWEAWRGHHYLDVLTDTYSILTKFI
jgi:hypothetical protein